MGFKHDPRNIQPRKGFDMNAVDQQDWFSPETTTFGDRLSGAREQAGLTQDDLARNIGVKLKTLRNWENDISEPRANRLSMMAGLLNVSLSWLLNGQGDGPATPDAGDLSDEATDILNEMREIQAQVSAFSDRLVLLEARLRAALRVDPGE